MRCDGFLSVISRVNGGTEGGGSLVDPGVQIDDDVDGSHDDFCCDESNYCNGAKSKQSCETQKIIVIPYSKQWREALVFNSDKATGRK